MSVCPAPSSLLGCTFFPGRVIISGRGFLIAYSSLALVAPWPLMPSSLIAPSFLVASLPLVAALKVSLLADFVLSPLATFVSLRLQFWHPFLWTCARSVFLIVCLLLCVPTASARRQLHVCFRFRGAIHGTLVQWSSAVSVSVLSRLATLFHQEGQYGIISLKPDQY